MIRIILALLLTNLLLINNAFAEDFYKVELIVFKHVTPNGLDEESWDKRAREPNVENASRLSLHEPNAETDAYELLPASDFDLLPEEKALNKKKDYKILLHVAWLQPVDKKSNPIHIFGGQAYSLEGKSLHIPLNTDMAFQEEDAPEPLVWEIDGTIKVNRSNYYSLKTNLTFTLPSSTLNQESPLNFFFRKDDDKPKLEQVYLNQSQRMRDGELHYFDHPLFGVLAEITPYNAKEE